LRAVVFVLSLVAVVEWLSTAVEIHYVAEAVLVGGSWWRN